MGLLPWSFGFLLIITILSWSCIGRMAEETIVTNTIIEVVQRQASELTEKISKKSAAAYRAICEKNGTASQDDEDEEEEEEKPAKKQRWKKGRRRLTSKLHVSALFSGEDSAQKPTQEKIFHNLLKVLYGSQALFTPQGNDDAYVQQLFDELRTKALELEPKFRISKAAFLANIELSGPKKDEKQFILFLILKGGKGEIFRGSPCLVHPLLNYIQATSKEVCISPYLAEIPLLMAIFENGDVVENIVEFRKNAYKRIQNEKEPAGGDPTEKKEDILEILSAEFKMQFEPLLPSGIDPQYIDFQVSSTKAKNF